MAARSFILSIFTTNHRARLFGSSTAPKCTATITPRDPIEQKIKLLNCNPASPISCPEFSEAFFSTWMKKSSLSGQDALTLGLAISGGVDSMALAVLCSELLKEQPNLRFKAFIVDHKVRDESATEASTVQEVLKERGIPSQVLTLKKGLQEHPNFESVARKLRFQALGQACRDHGIDSLFLAHHEGDQAETLMMRLIGKHRSLGLQGMKPSGDIPECDGIYGVSQSGGLSRHTPDTPRLDLSTMRVSKLWKGLSNTSIAIEDGGIKVYRPLLGFSKSRLLATCRAMKMTWFEDLTNADPKVTMRNAIRHMLRNHKMPAALQTSNLVAMSTRNRLNIDRMKALAAASIHLVRDDHASFRLEPEMDAVVIFLETRTGSLKVRVPSFKELKTSSLPKNDYGMAAALLLAMIIRMVIPQKQVVPTTLHQAVDWIFPDLKGLGDSEKTPRTFTTAGVLLQQCTPPPLAALTTTPPTKWLTISRQPPARGQEPHERIILHSHKNSSPKADWTDRELYDGRFWFRFKNRSEIPITINLRHFTKEDKARLKFANPDLRRKLDKLLADIAPSTLRWLLPVIAVPTPGVNGSDEVIAFPTLGLTLPLSVEPCSPSQQQLSSSMIDWEVRYRKVEMHGSH